MAHRVGMLLLEATRAAEEATAGHVARKVFNSPPTVRSPRPLPLPSHSGFALVFYTYTHLHAVSVPRVRNTLHTFASRRHKSGRNARENGRIPRTQGLYLGQTHFVYGPRDAASRSLYVRNILYAYTVGVYGCTYVWTTIQRTNDRAVTSVITGPRKLFAARDRSNNGALLGSGMNLFNLKNIQFFNKKKSI